MPYDYQVHIDQTKYEQVSQRLQNAKNILILPHKGMDGDTLGSALALGLALDQIGKKYTIASTDEEIGSVFGYMPKTDQIVDDFQETDFDTFVYIDHSEIYRTGFEKKHPHIEANIPNKIVIDHHQISKDLHCDDMLLDTQSPATAIIVYHLLRHMQIDIESDIATCLLTSIYTDTGGFMHNTTQEVWSLSGVLTDLGADQRSISKHIFQTKPIVQLKLWGLVLDRSYQNKHGILFSGITQEELDQA
ncbi:MAG: DHH family phosphoesterase [Patescibacteria group bacterium]|nr:DHH family phosphoesterase [Patescibacteria group bacterium]